MVIHRESLSLARRDIIELDILILEDLEMKKNENLENNLFLRLALKHVISAWQYILIGSTRQDEYLSGFDPLLSSIMIHS